MGSAKEIEITFIPNLQDEVHEVFHNEAFERLLQEAETKKPTLFPTLLDEINTQIYAARTAILYPHQSQPTENLLAACYQAPDTNPMMGWEYLVSDIGNIALEVAKVFSSLNKLNKPAKDAPENRVRLKIYAMHIVMLLRFMLLARLYLFRANINDPIGMQTMQLALQRPQDVLQKFRRAIRDYNQQVRSWGLNNLGGWKEAGDSIAFRSWSRDFGQIDIQEPAWEHFVRSIGTELRFHSRDAQLKQHWLEIRHPPLLAIPLRLLKICLLLAFKYSTGFGLKPERFIGTTIGTILIFSGLYFFDDVASGCNSLSPEGYGHEIYYAIANFTSIGASPGPCGGSREVLISCETLIGYFLLSALAALFFSWINDS